MPKRPGNPKPKSRKGLLPNQYLRESHVSQPRIRGADEPSKPGESPFSNDLYTKDNYIVVTHRLDGQWSYTVELKGEIFLIPGKVFDRMVSQRDSIIKEQRKVSAQRVHEAMRTKGLALADQIEASQEDSEREADLRGL
jgi:hypothetical protein